MIGKLVCVLLCVPILCAASGDKEYRAGQIINSSDETDASGTANPRHYYLLQIRDGETTYLALSPVAPPSGSDANSQAKPNSEIQFRVDNEAMFLRTADGNEIKAPLCHFVRPFKKNQAWLFVKCSKLMFSATKFEAWEQEQSSPDSKHATGH